MYYVQASIWQNRDLSWTGRPFHSLEYAKRAAASVGGRVWNARDVTDVQMLNGMAYFTVKATAKPVYE